MFVLNIGRFSSQYVNGMNYSVKLAGTIFPFISLLDMPDKIKTNHFSKKRLLLNLKEKEIK